jgi:hypothetical protein
MRTKMIAAIAAAGCFFGLQAAAFAQAQSGLSNMPNPNLSNPYVYAQPTTAAPAVAQRVNRVHSNYGQNISRNRRVGENAAFGVQD